MVQRRLPGVALTIVTYPALGRLVHRVADGNAQVHAESVTR